MSVGLLMSLRWEQELQRPPRAQAPVKLIVLAAARFLPLVTGQPSALQFRVIQRMLVGEMQQRLPVFPADAAEFGGDSVGVAATVIVTGVIDHAAVEVEAEQLAAAVVGLEDIVQEILPLDLKRTGQTRRQPKRLR